MTQIKGFVVAGLVAGLAAIAIAQAPQGAQSEGALRPRPGANREPEVPAPTIREYKPRSTLVVPQHPVPRAKFPVIDIHSHQPSPISAQQLATLVASMDPLNLRVLVNASGATGDRLVQAVAAQIERDVKNGALGVGEIMKDFGLRAKKTDGSRLRIDDPELDPIWQACARLNIPVLIHTADPQEFFQPIDLDNERWLELALFPGRRYPAGQFPTFEQINTERDNLFRRHPKTTFVMAHLGWHANDLGRLGRMFDAMPNVHGEVGAVLYDLGRQPRTAHAFFLKYQDRVLFGKDSYQPDEFPYFWRTFETTDEYFDYYRDYHAFWKLYGIGLPDSVLKKLYYQNALKLMPGLSRAGFPD